jgi:hypothetical protein
MIRRQKMLKKPTKTVIPAAGPEDLAKIRIKEKTIDDPEPHVEEPEILSGAIPSVLSTANAAAPFGYLEDSDTPIKPIKSDNVRVDELRAAVIERARNPQNYCPHKNPLEDGCFLCGTKSPSKSKLDPADTYQRPAISPQELAAQQAFSDQFREENITRTAPPPGKKISREILGISERQILEWLCKVVREESVIIYDRVQPCIKPELVKEVLSAEIDLAQCQDELKIREEQRIKFSAAYQKMHPEERDTPESRKIFLRQTNDRIAQLQRGINARQKELRLLKPLGKDILHWTTENDPTSARSVNVETRLRDLGRFCWPEERLVEVEEDEETGEATGEITHWIRPAFDFYKDYEFAVEFQRTLTEEEKRYEREVILAAFFLFWYNPANILQLTDKFPDLVRRRKDWDTAKYTEGDGEAALILKGGRNEIGAVHGRRSTHGWRKLSSFSTGIQRMGDGGGGDYGSNDGFRDDGDDSGE